MSEIDPPTGPEVARSIRVFLSDLRSFMDRQPGAYDLDGCAAWLQELNTYYARWAQVWGQTEGLYAGLVYHEIANMGDEEYKKIKNSSTITDLYVKGKYRVHAALYSEMDKWGKVLQAAADNTRTLLASYREERKMEPRTTTQQ